MVKLNKIYTRTGDDGTTGLGTGARVAKHDPRVEAFGTVDEANSFIGLARLHTAEDPNLSDLDAMLRRIQNDLFDLGADLCTPNDAPKGDYEPLRIVASQVSWLEEQIDELNGALDPLKSFILPGGAPTAAYLHVARTVIRRAERQMTELACVDETIAGTPAMHYVNRLSDFLFVAARWANDRGRADILWVPGENR